MVGGDDYELREGAADALRVIDCDLLQMLLRKAAADPTSSWRGHAVALLAQAVGAEALDAITINGLDRHPSDDVRREVVRALGFIDTPPSTQMLCRLAFDTSEDVRYAAVGLLEARRGNLVLRTLTDALSTDRRPQVRLRAARSLGFLGDRAAVVPLSNALTRDLDNHEAVVALGRLGDSAAIPALRGAWLHFGSKSWIVWAIARIGGAAAAKALADLLAVETTPHGRKELVDGIGTLSVPEAVPPLLAGSAEADAAVFQASLDGLWRVPRASLVAGLQHALADASPLVRHAAATAAPFYANEAMVALLRDLDGKDTDAGVRAAALNALRLIRERDARLTAL